MIRRETSSSVLVLLMLGSMAACAPDSPTIGYPAERPGPGLPGPGLPGPGPVFPALSHPGAVYDRVSPSSIAGSSRFVVYLDSTVALQFATPTFGFFSYAGTYSHADSLLTFHFESGNAAFPWIATGLLQGDSLIVKVNKAMALDDFEDGVYRSSTPLPGTERIYLANADGSAIASLTAGEFPVWSPNGQRIAFQRNGQVYVIDADGSNEIRLGDGANPSWSPSGGRIAFTNSDGIALMTADGSAITTLIRHDFLQNTSAPSDLGVGKPSWSPDGTRIAFEYLGDGDIQPAHVYVVNVDGTQLLGLTTSSDNRRYSESDPSWSPDGSKIVLWSYGYGIASVAASGGQPTSIYMNFPMVAYGTKPTWSPDGSNLAFTVRSGSSPAAIWTVHTDGSGARSLIPGGYDAAWSPSGGRIAFVSTTGK